jgi:hypothetical protein
VLQGDLLPVEEYEDVVALRLTTALALHSSKPI